jgi:hypothetical protein
LSREADREELYLHFIKETTNFYVDSLDKDLENPGRQSLGTDPLL